MGCYYHPDQPAVETCHTCGRDICIDCGVLMNGSVICKECLLYRSDLMKDLPRLKTYKDGRLISPPAYTALFANPGIVSGVVVTACMIVTTLYLYLNSSLTIFTPLAAIVATFSMVLMVYDVNKAMTKT